MVAAAPPPGAGGAQAETIGALGLAPTGTEGAAVPAVDVVGSQAGMPGEMVGGFAAVVAAVAQR